ncbi:MAG: FAD-binding oxidoreductase [Kofleriaceae bacterium]
MMKPAMERERSLWAWGWADKVPDDATRKGLVQLVRAFVPSVEPELRPMPGAPDVPAPRVTSSPPLYSSDPRDRALHTRGRAFPDLVAGFAGDFHGAPDLVARPRSTADVAQILEQCEARDWAVVPFGGGTSVVGGVDAAAARGDREAVVSLDLAELAGVREYDPVSRLARIGAGTFGPRLEQELAAHGMTLRHFPQSFEFSTLGGWLATRAGGHYATGPTHIDDHCHALELVTPRGTLATHRHPASGAGPEPARMVLGSEGAFGVITEAWMRVVPKPTHRASAAITFPMFDQGVAAARALAQSGLQPANARLLDPMEAKLHRVRFDGTAVLLVAFESADHPVSIDRSLELARDHGGTVTSQKSGDSWKQAFFDAPYLQSQLLSINVMSDTFETACTWTQFPSLDANVRAAVAAALPGAVVACRFTHVYPDGPAPYYTFVGPMANWREVKTAACDAVHASGGTITHHHAIGRTHLPWARRERGLATTMLAAIKSSLDPHAILNPGVMI